MLHYADLGMINYTVIVLLLIKHHGFKRLWKLMKPLPELKQEKFCWFMQRPITYHSYITTVFYQNNRAQQWPLFEWL